MRTSSRTRQGLKRAVGPSGGGASCDLFAKVRARLLGLLLLNSERGFYLSEAARLVGVAPRVASYNLQALSRMGILTRTVRGREVVYQANRSCPIFPELRSIMIKTVGLVDQVRKALAPIHAIDVAFIYGSFAEASERAESDIDLFVVGTVPLADLVRRLRAVQEALARPMNPVTMDASEFRRRLKEREHFVTTVVKGPKLFVRGDEHVLERLGGKGRAAKAALQPTGDTGVPEKSR